MGDDALHVVLKGTGHSNIAHNFWVQWAAETGGVGVFLYVAAVVAFLLCVGKALPSISNGFRRNLAIGCVAATVAACVDMIGAPSYSFPGVSSLPWLFMGMAVAACRPEKSRSETRNAAALPATPAWIWAASGAAGVAVALTIITIGAHQPAPHARSASAIALPERHLSRSQKMGIKSDVTGGFTSRMA
jgi:O-antigen ligase